MIYTSAYTVYTKTRQIPVYVLYQCQHCKKAVITTGTYSFSKSYSDATFAQKGAAKREQGANEYLAEKVENATSILLDHVKPITEEYRSIDCTCPYCKHAGLSKHDEETINRMKRRFSLITEAVGILALLIFSIAGGGIPSREIILFTLIATGIVAICGTEILDYIEKSQMEKASREATPMISMNKKRLLNICTHSRVYKDVDTKRIMDKPDLLEIRKKFYD